ncbi:MAG: TetR/AcrR family transcriptional regulator [Beijerinckiaceae bacterium]|nr:MAG: TetR/AcrR family transcriptional regulator [Beijerinckiaceae bacterium]
MTQENNGAGNGHAVEAASAAPSGNPRQAIVTALLELAGERNWEDISLSEIASRAQVSLATFREFFPSKGAVLSAFTRQIDKEVLDGIGEDLSDEPPKERLFDVLMRRLDVLAPYRLGIEGIFEWTTRDPMATAAVNRLMLNSMRFMLEAARIDSEGPVGALKLQGLTMAWRRVLKTWFSDDDPGLAATMAALDRELTRGSRLVARAEDLSRLTSPLVSIARALVERRRSHSTTREHWSDEREEHRPL